jgi:RNA polymerase sigma-70 factor, ECF subfamily
MAPTIAVFVAGEKARYTESMTIEEMVAAAQEGDGDAFGRVYESTRETLRGRVSNRVYKALGTASRDLVEDVISESYARAFARLDSYRSQDKFEAWLVTIARNVLLDRLKSAHGRREMSVDWDVSPWLEPVGAQRLEPEQRLFEAELSASTWALVDRLTAPQREAVLRRYYFEQSLAETAVAMDRTETTVKQLCFRARSAAAGWGVV